MDGVRTMLLGIALILFGIAASMMTSVSWCCGGAGLLLAIMGLLKQDGPRKS